MSPESFDALSRWSAEAPSRRVFLLQITTVFVYGKLARFGIRMPDWALVPSASCFRERDGMPCNGCGICQGRRCLGVSDAPCQAAARAVREPCGRCSRTLGHCTTCLKDQTCCTDGCCDGACTADGACCPKEKQCGAECCRGCSECQDGKCVQPKPKTSCPPNYQLIDGCCVCLPSMCGDQCCPEDQTCLAGKCCKRCGLDGAVCCDDRVCCRERCVDPGKPCCPCYEDISIEESLGIMQEAVEHMKFLKDNNAKYALTHSEILRLDCTEFVGRALGELNSKGHGLESRSFDGNCEFRRLPPGTQPRPGDIMAQPRPGAPGVQHVGISSGTTTKGGQQLGIAMGGKGVSSDSKWGPGGWFVGGDQLRIYRPQKRKPNCKE